MTGNKQFVWCRSQDACKPVVHHHASHLNSKPAYICYVDSKYLRHKHCPHQQSVETATWQFAYNTKSFKPVRPSPTVTSLRINVCGGAEGQKRVSFLKVKTQCNIEFYICHLFGWLGTGPARTCRRSFYTAINFFPEVINFTLKPCRSFQVLALEPPNLWPLT